MARAVSAMMGGAFSRRIEQWRQEVLVLSALTEAELDFSDEGDVETQNNDIISEGCKRLHDAIRTLVEAPGVEKLRDGLRVVLGGPPNSGKSTVLNALVARERIERLQRTPLGHFQLFLKGLNGDALIVSRRHVAGVRKMMQQL